MSTYSRVSSSQDNTVHHLALPNYPSPSQQSEHAQSVYAPPTYDPPSLYSHKPTNSTDALIGSAAVSDRMVSRTPSPTPSETEFLRKKTLADLKVLLTLEYWKKDNNILKAVIIIILLVAAILFSHYSETIVRAIEPTARHLRTMPAGWLIPIAILVVLSFPPLFGHEIIDMLCGVVWGFWIGLGIVCAGTLLGEIANFYAFRWCCTARGSKYEKTNLQYACYVKVIREGSFKIALIARYSAIPGHFLTAIFSTVGMHITTFVLAATLSLPKQAALVYVGTVVETEGEGLETKTQKILSIAIVVVTGIITYLAMKYIQKQVEGVKEEVVYAHRKSRQIKIESGNLANQSSLYDESIHEMNGTQGAHLYAPTPSRGSPELAEPHTDNNSYSMPNYSQV